MGFGLEETLRVRGKGDFDGNDQHMHDKSLIYYFDPVLSSALCISLYAST